MFLSININTLLNSLKYICNYLIVIINKYKFFLLIKNL